jgi:hypothetical protein
MSTTSQSDVEAQLRLSRVRTEQLERRRSHLLAEILTAQLLKRS